MEYITQPVREIFSLMPDSILFGSLLLYFLTKNLSYGVFAIFLFETVLSHKLISWIFSQSVGPSRPAYTKEEDLVKCRAGFKTAQTKVDRIFSHDQYPSYGLFAVTSIATYLKMATSEFADTMDAMGTEWQTRNLLVNIFIGLVVGICIVARAYTCDSVSDIVVALVLAIIVGSVFFAVNKTLFGQEAMNFLGLPNMVTKESQGTPIYVCAVEKSQ
jgi:hypothetical protein